MRLKTLKNIEAYNTQCKYHRCKVYWVFFLYCWMSQHLTRFAELWRSWRMVGQLAVTTYLLNYSSALHLTLVKHYTHYSNASGATVRQDFAMMMMMMILFCLKMLYTLSHTYSVDVESCETVLSMCSVFYSILTPKCIVGLVFNRKGSTTRFTYVCIFSIVWSVPTWILLSVHVLLRRLSRCRYLLGGICSQGKGFTQSHNVYYCCCVYVLTGEAGWCITYLATAGMFVGFYFWFFRSGTDLISLLVLFFFFLLRHLSSNKA